MIAPAHELYPWEGPMPELHLRGNPREIGVSHGQACRKWIKTIADNYWQALETPPLSLSREDIIAAIGQADTLIARHADEAYLDEMRGIAEGAGLAYEDIALANCGFDILVSRSDAASRAEMFSKFERLSTECASFVAWGRATTGGAIIGTHNDDGPRYPGQFQVIMIVEPDDGAAFISPSTMGKLGQHSMMNSHGLLVVGTGLDNGTRERVEEVGVPLNVVFRCITQHCSTTAEAIATLASLPLSVCANFVFADRNRDVEIIQATPFCRASVRPESEKDCLHVANHALVEEVKPYLSLRPLGSTHYRYQTIGRDLEANYGHITEDVAKRIMSSHFDWSVQGIHPCENSPCRHHEYKGELGGTNRCTVWDLDALTVQVALGNPCKADWVSISNVL